MPFGREDVTARLYREGEVLETSSSEDGTTVRARVDERAIASFREMVVR